MVENFGKYILLQRLASGGMAEVYLAKSKSSSGVSKFVAIKRILPQYSDNPEFIDMFKEEAKIAVNLNHGNVVSIYDFGVENKQFYLVMEFVEGQNLRQILNHMRKENKHFSLDQITYIAKEVAAGLDHAHRCLDATTGKPLNITHRDMSPQNIMISFEGEIKIVDFGIAKAESQLENTKAGTIKGKYGYMSPEQADGQTVDVRTDIFSAGIILWELMTNDRLFTAGSEAATLRKVRDCIVPPIRKYNPAVPPDLEKICLKALSKDKNLRYQTAASFYRDLNRFLNTQYPDFSSQDFSVFMKSTFSQLFMENRKNLVEFSKLGIGDEDLSSSKLEKVNVDFISAPPVNPPPPPPAATPLPVNTPINSPSTFTPINSPVQPVTIVASPAPVAKLNSPIQPTLSPSPQPPLAKRPSNGTGTKSRTGVTFTGAGTSTGLSQAGTSPRRRRIKKKSSGGWFAPTFLFASGLYIMATMTPLKKFINLNINLKNQSQLPENTQVKKPIIKEETAPESNIALSAPIPIPTPTTTAPAEPAITEFASTETEEVVVQVFADVSSGTLLVLDNQETGEALPLQTKIKKGKRNFQLRNANGASPVYTVDINTNGQIVRLPAFAETRKPDSVKEPQILPSTISLKIQNGGAYPRILLNGELYKGQNLNSIPVESGKPLKIEVFNEQSKLKGQKTITPEAGRRADVNIILTPKSVPLTKSKKK